MNFLTKIFNDSAAGLTEGVGKILDDVITNDKERLEKKNELAKIIYTGLADTMTAQATVLQTEMNGNGLQRNWRPVLMLAFGFIIIYRYFIAPVFHLELVELPGNFWDLLELGMGGFIIGRSAEKISATLGSSINVAMFSKKERSK